MTGSSCQFTGRRHSIEDAQDSGRRQLRDCAVAMMASAPMLTCLYMQGPVTLRCVQEVGRPSGTEPQYPLMLPSTHLLLAMLLIIRLRIRLYYLYFFCLDEVQDLTETAKRQL